jgi:hypothetical protein
MIILFQLINIADATTGTGIDYPSGAPDFIPGFLWSWFCLIFSTLLILVTTFSHFIICPSSGYGF